MTTAREFNNLGEAYMDEQAKIDSAERAAAENARRDAAYELKRDRDLRIRCFELVTQSDFNYANDADQHIICADSVFRWVTTGKLDTEPTST